MKIATYNVWNGRDTIDLRTEQLIHEIIDVDADILGLQEVLPNFWETLIKSSGYVYHEYRIIPNRGDGLALLSKYPLENIFFFNESEEFQNSWALYAEFKINEMNFSVTNVHLPWDSILAKEKQIVAVNEYACRQKDHVDFFILLGDFNCSYRSSVHNFLTGEQSLLNHEADPIWNDCAEYHASRSNYIIPPTLDFARNPRWGGKDNKQIPVTCDRIYLMDNAKYFDYGVENVSIFGTSVSHKTEFSPSDHYGVWTKINFF